MKKYYRLFLIISLFALPGMIAAQDAGRKLSTSLSGSAEVPGPGDTDGTGTASITLNQGKKQVCYELSVSNIGTATGAHIHRGAAGTAGAVVVTLMPPATGTSTGCADNVSEDLIKKIRQTPENFYVNIHNAEFPDGAVRGQLGKKMDRPDKKPTPSPTPNQ
jgi:CHRD domain